MKTFALLEAAEAQASEAPNDQPANEAERQIDELARCLDPQRWISTSEHAHQVAGLLSVANGAAAKLCNALADQDKALRLGMTESLDDGGGKLDLDMTRAYLQAAAEALR